VSLEVARWFGLVMFSHEATKLTKLIRFSDRETFLRGFVPLRETDFGVLFYLSRMLRLASSGSVKPMVRSLLLFPALFPSLNSPKYEHKRKHR
jgi:hypothetical protein